MLSRLLARAIDSVRIHTVWSERGQDGRTRIYKRRRWGMGAVIACGNVFLALSASRITMFPSRADWRRWEQHSFELCNGDRFSVGERDRSTIWTEQIPGRSLHELITRQETTPAVVTAAGEELHRVHQLHSPMLDTAWSHGDPHLRNVLYDANGRRARLIDFETLHLSELAAEQRHADDLLVLLLDLAGHLQGEALMAHAAGLLDGYGAEQVRPHLQARLRPPSGLELVLWQTRTGFLPRAALEQRIEDLRRVV